MDGSISSLDKEIKMMKIRLFPNKSKETLAFEKLSYFFNESKGHVWVAKAKDTYNSRSLSEKEFEKIKPHILKKCPNVKFDMFGCMNLIVLQDDGDNAMFIFFAHTGVFADG